MPDDQSRATAAPLDGIRIVRSSDVEWHEYPPMDGDETPPEHYGPGLYAPVFESKDGKVYVGLWKRDWDEGALLGGDNSIDIVLEGGVDVIDPDGTTHHAGPGDILMYRSTDVGRWEQKGSILKIFVSVKD